MDIVRAVLFLVGGLVILWKCAELLVAGAVGLAKRLGVSSLVIGLTVVAMGTSAPETAASITAALSRSGGGDIAVGNVFGSNIANLALVGGLVALIRPLRVKRQTLCREVPAMLLVALLLWPVLHNLYLSRLEGLVLLAVFSVLIILTVHIARKDKKSATETTEEETSNIEYRISNAEEKKSKNDDSANSSVKKNERDTKKSVLFIGIGLIGLALGAKIAVDGAVFIGEGIGLSKAVIGLTIIALGTSLPELATCVVAAIKGHHDISVGNLVGSNIFNTLFVTGVAGTVRAFEVGQRFAGGLDYWIMIIVSAAFTAAAIIGRRVIGRVSGVLLLCGYAGYIVYLLAYSG